MNKKLKRADELKSAVLNVTSHELRTPMSSIKGYIQMLLKGTLGDVTDEQKRSLEIVLRNTNRLNNLIQDILDVSRLESEKMKFIPKKTNIEHLMNEVIETMQSSASRKEIRIRLDIDKGVPEVIIDQDRITQVVINLINNAIKFSPKGSAINLRVKNKQETIEIEVMDFGRGIPKEAQDKIFETFYQVDSGKDRKFGGAGLGLAICRGIVLSHGGQIWVESTGKPGEGSTFRFTLPIIPVQDLEGKFRELDIFGLGEIKEKTENDLRKTLI